MQIVDTVLLLHPNQLSQLQQTMQTYVNRSQDDMPQQQRHLSSFQDQYHCSTILTQHEVLLQLLDIIFQVHIYRHLYRQMVFLVLQKASQTHFQALQETLVLRQAVVQVQVFEALVEPQNRSQRHSVSLLHQLQESLHFPALEVTVLEQLALLVQVLAQSQVQFYLKDHMNHLPVQLEMEQPEQLVQYQKEQNQKVVMVQEELLLVQVQVLVQEQLELVEVLVVLEQQVLVLQSRIL